MGHSKEKKDSGQAGMTTKEGNYADF